MEFLNSLIFRIAELGPLLYGAVFVIAALESIVFLGLLIPGTLLIVFLGFLAAQNDFNLLFLLLATAAGASFGDYASYYLGYKKGNWVGGLVSKFGKADYIGSGESFFRRHGDKSVLFGRFVAVVRPFIPFIAGVFKMNGRTFFLWNLAGAFLWSLLYLCIGYFFGYAWRSAALWVSRIGIILFVTFILLVIGYYVKRKLVAAPSAGAASEPPSDRII